MNIFARQGDLVIEKLSAPIDGDLERTQRVVFAGDSSGHPHFVAADARIRREGRVTLLRLEAPATLEHAGAPGHRAIEMPAGDYLVRPLRERGDGSDRAVED
jgi:hypothetical protein